ncbi:TRAP transporter small permease [Bacillus sp. 1P02SD]|uniref:TRAP transporter small permease n=1 Tax=Bacillus sp. 1P02SD TaxID=3132264 RepID=UPI0039A3900C
MLRLKNILVKFLDYLTYILLLQFTIVVFLQVVLRYVFNITFFWSDEFTRYSLVWLVFLGTAVLSADKEHIRVGFLVDLLPVKLRKCVEIVVNILCITFVAVISIFSYDYLLSNMDVGSISLKIPMGLLYGVFPLAGVFIILFLLMDCIDIVKQIFSNDKSTSSEISNDIKHI